MSNSGRARQRDECHNIGTHASVGIRETLHLTSSGVGRRERNEGGLPREGSQVVPECSFRLFVLSFMYSFFKK